MACTPVFAGVSRWPFEHTDPVSVRLLDAETGKPVPAVILEGIWTAERIAFGFESRSDVQQRERWISDAEGRISIPAFSAFSIAHSINGLSVSGTHPIYGSINIQLFDRRAPKKYVNSSGSEIDYSAGKVEVVAHLKTISKSFGKSRCIAQKSRNSAYRDGIEDSCRPFLTTITRSSDYFNRGGFSDKIKEFGPTREACENEWRSFLAIAYRESPLIPVLDPTVFDREVILSYRPRR